MSNRESFCFCLSTARHLVHHAPNLRSMNKKPGTSTGTHPLPASSIPSIRYLQWTRPTTRRKTPHSPTEFATIVQQSHATVCRSKISHNDVPLGLWRDPFSRGALPKVEWMEPKISNSATTGLQSGSNPQAQAQRSNHSPFQLPMHVHAKD